MTTPDDIATGEPLVLAAWAERQEKALRDLRDVATECIPHLFRVPGMHGSDEGGRVAQRCAVTPARLEEIVAAMRSEDGWRGSPYELSRAFLLLADIRDAERALRVAVAECVGPCCVNDSDGSPVDHASRILRALGVEP